MLPMIHQSYATILDGERKEKHNIITSRICALITISLVFWFCFCMVIIARPVFWGSYDNIIATPFILSKPVNSTIFATPCVLEITPPYYNNYTCNTKYNHLDNRLLTCPDNYFCANYNDTTNKICILNDTYFCPFYKYHDAYNNVDIYNSDEITTCYDLSKNILGEYLVHVESIASNVNYTEYEIFIMIYTIMIGTSYILMLAANYVAYAKDIKHIRIFHLTLYTATSIMYYLNTLLILVLSYVFVPNVSSYKKCFDMSLIIFSKYNIEVYFVLITMVAGMSIIMHTFSVISLVEYFKFDKKRSSLLDDDEVWL